MMTQEEETAVMRDLFERSSRALLAQGMRSWSGRGTMTEMCRYRAPGGLKCAIGHLIPDEAYDPLMEGVGVCSLQIISGRWLRDSEGPASLDERAVRDALARALEVAGIPATPRIKSLLESLQWVHDDVAPAGWSAALDRLRRTAFDAPGTGASDFPPDKSGDSGPETAPAGIEPPAGESGGPGV